MSIHRFVVAQFVRAGSVLAGVVVVLAAGLANPAAAQSSGNGYNTQADNAPSAAAMTADLLIARPLGLAATVLGTAVFVVSLPFQALAGNVSDPARRLVVEPAAFTFVRPLGSELN